MESKQTFAKFGVFLLLAVNVVAYYYFWPRNDATSKAVAKDGDKGEAQLLPHKIPAAVIPEPMPIAPSNPMVAIPLAIPGPGPVVPALPTLPQPAPSPAPAKDDDTRAILKLLEHIERKAPEAPAVELVKREDSVKSDSQVFLPMKPLQIEAPDVQKPMNSGIAIAPPLAPKAPPALWVFHTDNVGKRVQLTARLREAGSERIAAEFLVVCDRVETNPQSGEVQALGNVAFTGAGWKGSCQKLTLTVHEPRLVFEQSAQVTQDILGSAQMSIIRGERIVWGIAPNAGDTRKAPAASPRR